MDKSEGLLGVDKALLKAKNCGTVLWSMVEQFLAFDNLIPLAVQHVIVIYVTIRTQVGKMVKSSKF